MREHAPWDAGLQNERTGLAWQRTMLSGLACSLLVARLLAPRSLTLAVLTGLVALLGTAVLGTVSLRRFRVTGAALHGGRPVGDGRAPLLIAALVILTAAGALAYVLIA
ncbi:MAG: uncharacterized protein JWP61_859 [Friedmanniella sp.]|nr:uncharacterized protein [Friedmanniella sp.]